MSTELWQRYPIVSDQHGYAAGLALGMALKHGLPVEPILDPDGNYTAAMWLALPGSSYSEPVSIVIVTADPGVAA